MKLLIATQKVDKNDPVLGFFHAWIKEFARHCSNVTVICLEKGEYDLPGNVFVRSLGKERGASRISRIIAFYRYSIWERKNYDTVFVHMNPEYIVLGGLLWRVWGKTVALWYAHKSVNLKLRIASAFAHIIFTPSKNSFRLRNSKVRITGHGIDTEAFAPRYQEMTQPDESFRVLTFGRISPSKKYELMLEAVSRLEFPCELRIAGAVDSRRDTAYKEQLLRMAEKLGIADSVRFVGAVPHAKVPALLTEADVFVNTSATGSLDKAILEAMSAGVPVVSSNDSFVDVISDDLKEICVAAPDPKNIAEKVSALMSLGREDRHAIGKRLREIVVRKHSLSSLMRRLANDIEQYGN